MQVGTKLHGFTVERVRELPELQARLWEMTHDKTGAQLCWLDCVDYYSQLIHTTPDDLLALCDALDDITADNAICVVAGQSQMDGCGDKLTSRLSV